MRIGRRIALLAARDSSGRLAFTRPPPADPLEVLYVRVTAPLKARIEAAAAAEGVSVNRWAQEALERAFRLPRSPHG